MSIVPLAKVTLYGLVEEKASALDDLQTIGCLHLVPVRPAGESADVGGPSPQARNALKFLLDCPERRRQVQDPAKFDAADVERRALEIQARMQNLQNERDFLVRRIRDLEPWGEFTLPPPEDLANFNLWFYVVPHYQMKQVQATDLIWELVHRDNRFCYVVIIAEREPQGMPGERTHTGTKPRSELKRRLEEVEVELEDLQAERGGLTRWLDLFARSLSHLEDQATLAHASQQTYDAEPLFAVQGWAPRTAVPRLDAYAQANRFALVVEDPASDDKPPTLFHNPELVAGGQDLVSFYMTPSYADWDPSIVVFFSFSVFFAMILSDAGYAALLGLILVGLWRRMGHSNTGRRLRTLFTTLVAASAAWGVLVGSYFGIAPPESTLLAKLKVLDIRDFDTMMLLSILIGVAHVVVANVAKARRGRGNTQALAPLGWCIILVGGTSLWLGTQGIGAGVLDAAGPWIMALGGVVILFFTSDKPTLPRRLLGGLLGMTRLTNAFGDVLSYLRLFALGLASASLALAFNDLAAQAGSVRGFGKLLAFMILIVGHGMNFVLAIMSGVVHGLRLNMIEFFNWGLSEEGHPFRAFAKKEVTTWTPSSSP
ncbi:MAG: hypothetical protein V3T84_13770 [Phycisphaerales bacterium]